MFEAEAGTVVGGLAVAADPLAAAGSYVLARSAGSDTFAISVPTAGTYMIAGWVEAPNASADSFTVSLDNGAAAVWNLPQPTTAWTYDATTNPTFTLAAGTHTLTVGYREVGAAVDRMVLLQH